jgi:hypothetical protein
MPTRDELLRTQTHKEDGLSLPERVFRTLRPHELEGRRATLAELEIQAHRNSLCLAQLVALLHRNNALTTLDLDELLLDVVR